MPAIYRSQKSLNCLQIVSVIWCDIWSPHNVLNLYTKVAKRERNDIHNNSIGYA